MSTGSPRYLPYLSFYPVNQNVIKKLVLPYIKLSTVVLGSSVIGSFLPKVWDQIPVLMSYLGLKQGLERSTHLFWDALLYSVFGLLLIGVVYSKLMDAQFILSIAKSLLLIGLLFSLCGFVSLFPNTLIVHKILLCIVLIFTVFRGFVYGLMRYYWDRKSYGDLFLEILVLCLFLYILWSPITTTLLT
jgi:hypothetical protein